MDIVVAILIFIGVVIIATLFFGGWVIVAIVRLLGRALGGGGGRSYAPPARLPPPLHRVLCPHHNCRSDNAQGAAFCRRCGRPFALARPAAARRVAML